MQSYIHTMWVIVELTLVFMYLNLDHEDFSRLLKQKQLLSLTDFKGYTWPKCFLPVVPAFISQPENHLVLRLDDCLGTSAVHYWVTSNISGLLVLDTLCHCENFPTVA